MWRKRPCLAKAARPGAPGYQNKIVILSGVARVARDSGCGVEGPHARHKRHECRKAFSLRFVQASREASDPGQMRELPDELLPRLAGMGSFDCVNTPPRGAFTSLRMTDRPRTAPLKPKPGRPGHRHRGVLLVWGGHSCPPPLISPNTPTKSGCPIPSASFALGVGGNTVDSECVGT